MNYKHLNLYLNEEHNGHWNDLFGIPEERSNILDKKVKMAKQIFAIEEDLLKAIDYFLAECKDTNESNYCWFKMGQRCECSLNGKVKVLSGTIEVGGNAGPADVLDAIFKDLLKNKGKGYNPSDLGDPLG